MVSNQDRSTGERIVSGNDALVANRRRFLAAIGAGGAGAVAGCLGSDGGDDGSDDGDDTDDSGDDNADDGDDGDDEPTVDARFGLTVPDGESTSLEPDHTVSLVIEEREEIPIPAFYFEPTGLYVEAGDTVEFEFATPHHNVNAYHPAFGYEQRVPDDAPPYSSPILGAGDSWYFTFEQEGVHDIVCAPHEIFGMAGRIVVGSATGPGAEPVGEAGQGRPPDLTSGLVLSDPALDPDAIVDEGSVSWDDLDDESKQILVEFPEPEE